MNVKIPCLCPGIESLSLGHAALSLVTKLTELSRDRGSGSEQLSFVDQILEREKKYMTSKSTIVVNTAMNTQSKKKHGEILGSKDEFATWRSAIHLFEH